MWNTTTLKKTFKLTKLYRELNEKYFGNRLSKFRFEVVPVPGDIKSAAAIVYHRKRTGGNTATIFINSRISWNGTTIHQVLLHEMIHYYLFVVTGRRRFFSHSLSFIWVMLRINLIHHEHIQLFGTKNPRHARRNYP